MGDDVARVAETIEISDARPWVDVVEQPYGHSEGNATNIVLANPNEPEGQAGHGAHPGKCRVCASKRHSLSSMRAGKLNTVNATYAPAGTDLRARPFAECTH